MFLLRTAATGPPTPSAVKSTRPSGGASSHATSTTLALKFLSIYNEISDIFGEVIPCHAQSQYGGASNLRSVFTPYRTTAFKQGQTGNQESALATPRGVALKKEPLNNDAIELNDGILKRRIPSSLDRIKEVDHRVCFETSIGEINCCLKWKKRKLHETNETFAQQSECHDNEAIRSKKKNIEEEGPSREKSALVKEKVNRLSQKFFKVKRIRLIDLARIPSTTYILV